MIKLFLFKFGNDYIQNWIDAYIYSLYYCFKHTSQITLYVINIDFENNEVVIRNLSDGSTVISAYARDREFVVDFLAVALSLRSRIVDSNKNVFVLNNSPCSKLILELRQCFTLTRIIYIIHNQGWCDVFWGREFIFREFIRCNSRVENEVERSIINYFIEECRIYKLSDSVVCLSKSTLNLLSDLYGMSRNKIKLIPHGCCDQRFSKINLCKDEARIRLGISPNTKLGIFVGRLTRLKGIEILLRALVEMQDVMHKLDMKVVLIGPINLDDDLKAICRTLSDRLILTGRLSQENVMQWYNAADVGIIPSYTEQCSFVALEMMWYGLTVVASNCNGLKDMFTRENAFIADIDEPSRYIRNLKNAIHDAFTASESIRQNKLSTIKSQLFLRYSVETMRKSYLSLFSSIVRAVRE